MAVKWFEVHDRGKQMVTLQFLAEEGTVCERTDETIEVGSPDGTLHLRVGETLREQGGPNIVVK